MDFAKRRPSWSRSYTFRWRGEEDHLRKLREGRLLAGETRTIWARPWNVQDVLPGLETANENYVPPPPPNDNAFFTGLSSSVLGRLVGPQMADLDGDETRHKILFCDGMLYNFKERVLRSPIPADRMGFHAKATSEMWQPSKATKLFEHILAFLKEQVLEASENGKQVIECFEELEQDGCEISAT